MAPAEQRRRQSPARCSHDFVAATNDVDALLALKPDCVIYNPMYFNIDEIVCEAEYAKTTEELDLGSRTIPKDTVAGVTIHWLDKTTGFEPATLTLARSQQASIRSRPVSSPAVPFTKSSNRYSPYQPDVDRSTKQIVCGHPRSKASNQRVRTHKSVAPNYGTISNAPMCEGRTTVKSRRSNVAIVVMLIRSAITITDASTSPSPRSAY